MSDTTCKVTIVGGGAEGLIESRERLPEETPTAGSDRFIVVFRDGEHEWASVVMSTEAEALEHVRFVERRQPLGFADSYRVERLSGAWAPLVCVGRPDEEEAKETT